MQMIDLKYDEVFSYENLYNAHIRGRKCKRDKKPIVKFEMNMLENLVELHKQLSSRRFRITRYHSFIVNEPKRREIQTLDYRVRIVQHILCDDILAPFFTKHAILDNCVCQKGKGMHFALKRFEKMLREYIKINGDKGWVLKCDIKKYFASIPHDRLKQVICSRIKDEDIKNLVADVIDSYHTHPDYLARYGFDILPDEEAETRPQVLLISQTDTKYSKEYDETNYKNKVFGEIKTERIASTGRGIPIGNQTSQIFGMFYLDKLDRYIKEQLRIKIYSRYMDDFILIHNDKSVIARAYAEIQRIVTELGLTLNSKTQVSPLKNGLKYLGFRYYVTKEGKLVKQVAKKTKRRMKWRVRLLKRAYADKTITKDRVKASISAFHGHLKHANCKKLENNLTIAVKAILDTS